MSDRTRSPITIDRPTPDGQEEAVGGGTDRGTGGAWQTGVIGSSVERRRPLLGPATVCTEYTVWRPYPLSEESSACVLSERLVCARGSRREERPRDPCVSVSVPLAGHGPLDPPSTQASAHTGRRVVSLTERGGTGEREVDYRYRVTTACSSARRGSYDERVEHEQNGEPHFLASCMLNHTRYHRRALCVPKSVVYRTPV